ncbi:MAG: hypothetical protein JRI85_17420 [Deltaproteobacteria bacterium]|nr:hypothetical protein [Deltaproteobacteria bacterium]
MSKVFFGGSRKMGRLSQAVRDRTDNIIANGYLILVGDANGADKAMQRYLSEKSYRKVLVFCMDDVCRNNVGKWETRHVPSSRSKKDFHYYSTKDTLMSDEADYGFMLWDGKSKGTLNNIFNLYDRNKKILVYFSPTRDFYLIRDKQDLSRLLDHCDSESLRKSGQALLISRGIHLRQQLLNFS